MTMRRMDVGSRLRALDDALLGQRLTTPMGASWHFYGFLLGATGVVSVLAIAVATRSAPLFLVAASWAGIVGINGAQWRRSVRPR